MIVRIKSDDKDRIDGGVALKVIICDNNGAEAFELRGSYVVMFGHGEFLDVNLPTVSIDDIIEVS